MEPNTATATFNGNAFTAKASRLLEIRAEQARLKREGDKVRDELLALFRESGVDRMERGHLSVSVTDRTTRTLMKEEIEKELGGPIPDHCFKVSVSPQVNIKTI